MSSVARADKAAIDRGPIEFKELDGSMCSSGFVEMLHQLSRHWPHDDSD
jgi:hypothetical protein